MTDVAERLITALGEDSADTGIVFSAVYQPVGGPGGTVMPPTFPTSEEQRIAARREGRFPRPYLFEERWVDGTRRSTVVVDQVPSQANRVEEALLDARDCGRLPLPLFELEVKEHGVRLTSLDFPHRFADAYLRDSEVGGVRFDKSEVGRALRSATAADVRPLFEREPYSLVFGAWDSHRKGRPLKLPRIYTSSMFGLEPLDGGRQAGKLDPVNLSGAIDDKAKAESDWRFLPEGAKRTGGRLSEIGHGNIAPNPGHGGVTVDEIRRRGWVSFAGLRRLRFGDVSPEAALLGRATLAALALAGDRLAFGRASVWLRSGCDLTRISDEVGIEQAGGQVEALAVTAADAVAAFVALRERAATAGLPMAGDVVPVTPTPQLAAAIRYAVTQAVGDGE
ncbi:type I-U CRISPR-associated RAMP protein Csb1/Cas7u [Actinoplanes oblitus]|uniref:Type I-U CRISPR-associated RAMP protein Csb1/Cas7u n=1 Tax=Actinoplanes oblitus TaxID=3040509 RepID=A0ABY8WX09_9ACTN|nr:type I-U CRISPR-associated RAMP protein Csb1/Cas7u [Actinoplanes oblitus]WIN00816.1 type I-U CRISPR-associated RAMP protein Csb1/Cas7u [Actinoplanes oblitus]